jgi:hypothetical protein
MSINMQEVQLLGITRQDIQDIFEKTLQDYKVKPGILFIDASYLYTFNLDDFVEVRKFNILGRYDINAVKQWHNCLERWLQDQTVILGNKSIKPIAISRTFDRVVNEGMEIVAGCITGTLTDITFPYRSIGDGTASTATPGDKILGNEIDRINVNDSPEGGSLSRDGTTIYSVGNHSKDIETPVDEEFTECGMHSTDSPTTDKMLDHSVFDDPIPHIQHEDAPGSTTVIYMCSS